MTHALTFPLVLLTAAASSSLVLGQNEARDVIDEAVNKAVDAVEANYATFVEANTAPLEAARTFLNAQVLKLNTDKKFNDATKVQTALADLDKTVMQKAVPLALAGPKPKPKVQLPRERIVKFAFTPAELNAEFLFISDCKVNSRNEIECSGRNGRAVTKKVFSIPLRAEFEVVAFKDRAIDIFPSIHNDPTGDGGIVFLWGHNGNVGSDVVIARRHYPLAPHVRIIPEQQYRITIAIDGENTLTVSRDDRNVFTAKLPINAPREGHISCDGGLGHVAYRSLTVTTQER